MANEKTLGEVVLTDVRLSFPHIDEPDSSVQDGPKKFSASFLIDPNTESGKKNVANAKAAFMAVAEERWKDKTKKILEAIEPKRKFLLKGEQCTNDEGDVYAGYEGMIVVKSTRPGNSRLPVVNRRKEPVKPGDDQWPYAGCYVDAVVRFYTVADKDKGGNGVFCSLEAVRFRRDGEAFGAPPVDTDSAFEDLDDDDFEDGDSRPAAVDEDDLV